jgi:hypothetical protein
MRSGRLLRRLASMWLESDAGITLGTAPRATGTSPPAVTISGQLEQSIALRLEVQTTGLRGTATFRWSTDGGATWAASGVLTAATAALGSTGITAAFPAGTYTSDNVYQGTVATWADQSPNAKSGTQATAANRPIARRHTDGPGVSVYFDAANVGLAHTLTLQAPCTLAVVASSATNAAGAYQTLATFNASGGDGLFAYLSSGGSSGWGIYYGAPLDSGTSLLNSFKACVARVRAVADLDLRTNGASVTRTGGLAAYGGGATIGEPAGAAQPMLGDVAFLAAFNRVLSVRDCLRLERYIRRKYCAA